MAFLRSRTFRVGELGPDGALDNRGLPLSLCAVAVAQRRPGRAAPRSREWASERLAATTPRRTARARWTRWPFSKPALRSDPAGSPGVYATATALSDSAGTGPARYRSATSRSGEGRVLKPLLSKQPVELAGLEPATSWVRFVPARRKSRRFQALVPETIADSGRCCPINRDEKLCTCRAS